MDFLKGFFSFYTFLFDYRKTLLEGIGIILGSFLFVCVSFILGDIIKYLIFGGK
jgi:hypothetical protein